MLIVDGHLDLAYSALRFKRDLRQDVATIRAREGRADALPNGRIMVTIPELLEGGVGLVLATIFMMPRSMDRSAPGNARMLYTDAEEAYRGAVEQLDYYHRLAEELETVRLVDSVSALEEVLASHEKEDGQGRLLGLVPLLEGADAVRHPQELREWHERGLRVIGPAWDDTRYAYGAWKEGQGFTADGRRLMEVMADLGFTMDVTHLSERATFEAFDRYEGPLVATHCNTRALVPGQRQLSDEQIRRLAERDGVMGVVMFNGFLKADYRQNDPPEAVTLNHVVAHIDHVCQLLGDADHVGIGSDLDGGFGAEDTPAEIDTVADLQKIGPALAKRGYSDEHVAKIMGQNWIDRLRRALG